MSGNNGQGSNWITKKRRAAIYARDKHRCVWCTQGVIAGPLPDYRADVTQLASLDHVQPRARGGDNRTPNLLTCCMGCNRKRGDQTVRAFAFMLAAEAHQHPMQFEKRAAFMISILVRVIMAISTPLPRAE